MTRKFLIFIFVFTCFVVGSTLISFKFLKIEILYEKFLTFALLSPILLLISYLYRKRDINIATAAMTMFLGALFTNAHLLPMFAIARLKGDFRDGVLANIDKFIGLEVTTVFLSAPDFIKIFFLYVYDSLTVLLALALMIPSLLGQNTKIREFLLALILATCFGFVLFFFFQAEGPWKYYGYTPLIQQTEFGSMYYRVRNESVFIFDPSYDQGLICFPSFHTILAVLSGYALSKVPYFRWFFIINSVLVVVSTVMTGTHYVVDSLVGIIIAVISIYIAKKINLKYNN